MHNGTDTSIDGVTLQVSDAIDLINTTLDEVYPFIIIEGEVASFKVNQGKFVFFDIKDSSGTLGCFMMVFKLKFPIEDGMKVRVVAQPKLTQWGRFSLTVDTVQPVGEGSLKKSMELLKKKLEDEGLFDTTRKRALPKYPVRIGVVSSSQAAGYKDFIKILQNRWGGLQITLADCTVQGDRAPSQIVGALRMLNELPKQLDVIAVVRGGGSADDLATFSHEDVVRAIAGSRAPIIVGVGHEVDVSLADLAADVRAATPSNVAEILVPDKREVIASSSQIVLRVETALNTYIRNLTEDVAGQSLAMHDETCTLIDTRSETAAALTRTLQQLNPQTVLQRGYAVARRGGEVIQTVSNVTIGDRLDVQLRDGIIKTEVKNVR